jgi:hypothetical protein
MMLIARAAGSRFLRHRRRAARESAGRWRPLAMRWRRARRLHRQSTPPARPSLIRSSWQPHFHWHLSVSRGDSRLRGIATRLPASARLSRLATTIREHRWHAPVTSLLSWPPRAGSPRRQWRRAPAVHVRGIRSARAETIIARGPERAAQRSSRAIRRDIDTTVLRRVQSIERTLSATSVIRHRRDVSMRWRVRHEQGGATAERPRAVAQVRTAFRPAEIAWRTAGNPVSSHDRQASKRGVDATTHAPQQGIAQHVTIPVAPTEARRPAVLQVSDLDPAVVDRLTDDVIRRVERRVRIERERRGM